MSYIGNQPVVQASRFVSETIASAGQTSFYPAAGYTPGYLDVEVNGSTLASSDYTADDGSSVVLSVGCGAGDVVRFVAFGNFTVADAYTKGEANVLLAAKASLTGTETLTNKTIQNSTIQGGALTLATAVTASGTAVDFTSIPSWAKRITVMLSGVSTSGIGSSPEIRIGTSGGVEASGYAGTNHILGTGIASVLMSSGFTLGAGNWSPATVAQGAFVIENIGGNTWVCSGAIGASNSVATFFAYGSKTLSGVLDRVRITTINGTDAFDAGTINIMYEG